MMVVVVGNTSMLLLLTESADLRILSVASVCKIGWFLYSVCHYRCQYACAEPPKIYFSVIVGR